MKIFKMQGPDLTIKCNQCKSKITTNISSSFTVKDKVISCIQWKCDKCEHENTVYYPFGSEVM